VADVLKWCGDPMKNILSLENDTTTLLPIDAIPHPRRRTNPYFPKGLAMLSMVFFTVVPLVTFVYAHLHWKNKTTCVCV
jgi:hypothetical protein